jgi:NAD(P)-dependent dehydrogenase (short-subunit alcohol dehydrogenase family)
MRLVENGVSPMTIRFDGKVAIVTGAGNGLGRSHALGLAARGAKVVVNDLGGKTDGTGGSSEAARKVVAEITAKGGEAIANGANVAKADEVEAMVAEARKVWGKVDILINNAGILRDKTFTKMTLDDFRAVMEVHLMGSVNCTKAVWDGMRAQNYGRIVMTSSSSGIYGNFGQSNYAAAKMGVVGLMNSLSKEGEKNNVRVNTLAPSAATRMTEALIPPDMLKLMQPETITPGVLFLVSENAPNNAIMGAGAGTFAVSYIYETDGVFLPDAERTPEGVAARWKDIANPQGQHHLKGAYEQTDKLVLKAAEALGIKLPGKAS